MKWLVLPNKLFFQVIYKSVKGGTCLQLFKAEYAHENEFCNLGDAERHVVFFRLFFCWRRGGEGIIPLMLSQKACAPKFVARVHSLCQCACREYISNWCLLVE